jgi:C_GCAxxG_C_C family probable redox protein
MTKSEEAMQYFRDGFNCAQSVLVPFRENFGIDENHCLKIACAFGAGMGRQQHTCGAVTGAVMVLGLQYGKGKQDDNTKKLATYGKTVAFFEEFAGKHGSTSCLELLEGLRMSDPEDMKKIEELELHRIKCASYVRDAVEMVEKMIGDSNDQ